jgi:signal transduction histidine kinase/ligand-binding sensor domain-containing protein
MAPATRLGCGIVIACLCGCTLSAAQAVKRTIGQFAHTTWGSKEGAPSVINALAQSADGYLWLGGPTGLYRFDGVFFERYQPLTGAFPAQDVTSLLAVDKGDLWIGFRNGAVSVLRDGNLTSYAARDGLPGGVVWGLQEDREGTIWAATSSGIGRLDENRWTNIGKDWNFPGKTANSVFLDHAGNLWVSTENTLVFLPPGAKQFQSTGISLGEVSQVAQAPNGRLWMAETTRSVRPVPLAEKRQPADGTEVQVGSIGILFDREGALWITTVGDGLRRALAPELLKGKIKEFSTAVESFTAKDGLSDDFVRTIFQDREGNIWVGTNNGLDRFRKSNLVPVAFPFKTMYAVLAAGDAGDLWIQHLKTLFRVHGTVVDHGRLVDWQAGSTYRDRSGGIWWLCPDALHRSRAGTYTTVALPTTFPKPAQLRRMEATEDGSGLLWLSAEGEGLFKETKDGWQRLEAASDRAKLSPRTAFTDGAGRAWFGYMDGTIILVQDRNVMRVFPSEGSPVGGVKGISGRGRHIWIGGELGLAYFNESHFLPVIPTDAGGFGFVWGITETSDGSLWLAESRGVIQVPASEVEQFLQNPHYQVKYRIFDSFEGLPGTFAGSAKVPDVVEGTDGRLWFAASAGIAWIDPANVSTNSLAPPVSIRSVEANGNQLNPVANLVLPPRTTNLQISYTALSLAVPERVRFRYKLEGIDKEWQEAGTRREAIYTNLTPGNYQFQVIACNNDGIWNETGASLALRVVPAWYQTIWFRSLYVLASALFLWVLYQLRLRHLARQFNIRLEERVGERTRIARELHDTLLQNLHGVLFQFQAARNMVLKRPEEAIRTLDDALVETEEAIAESQDAIRDLRSENVAQNDLAQLLTTIGNELRSSKEEDTDRPAFVVVQEGEQRALLPVIQDEVYRIAREVLRNAFQHARAHHIEAEIRYDEQAFRLRIRDDGVGIDPEVLKRRKRGGHWGLPGIQERAHRIGAKLDLWSELGAGTEVQLTISAAVAHEAQRGRPRSRLIPGAKQ